MNVGEFMPGVLRINGTDVFVCGAVTKVPPLSPPNVFVNNVPAAKMGDLATHDNISAVPVDTSSATVFINNIGVARVKSGSFPGDHIPSHLLVTVPPIPDIDSFAITGSLDVFVDEGPNAALYINTIESSQLAEFEVAQDYLELIPEVNTGASYLLAATTFTDDEESDNSQGLSIYPPPAAVPTNAQLIMNRSIQIADSPTLEIAPPPTAPPPNNIPSNNDDIFNHVGEFSGDFQLSPNIKLKDVTTHTTVSNYKIRAQVNLSEKQIVSNLRQVCVNILEPLYVLYPTVKWRINSGFRHFTLTDTGRVSQHCKGQAVDVEFLKLDNVVMNKTAKYEFARDNIQNDINFDQFIFETRGGPTTWYHFSFVANGNRRDIRTSSVPGKYQSGIHKIA